MELEPVRKNGIFKIILISVVIIAVAVVLSLVLMVRPRSTPTIPNMAFRDLMIAKSQEISTDLTYQEVAPDKFPSDFKFIIPDGAQHTYFGKTADDRFYRISFFSTATIDSLYKNLSSRINDQGFKLIIQDYTYSSFLIVGESDKYRFAASLIYFPKQNQNYIEVEISSI